MIDVGQVIALPNDGDTVRVWAPAVGFPLAVIVPGFTAPTVVEEVSWQHKSLESATFVSAVDGG